MQASVFWVHHPCARLDLTQRRARLPASLRGSPAGALGPVGGWIPDKVLSIGRVDGAPALLDHISEVGWRWVCGADFQLRFCDGWG